MPRDPETGGQRSFPETRWSLIVAAQDDAQARAAALEELVGRYWKPLYFYARRKGQDAESARDTIQGFLVHLLERDFLERLNPEKGKLRGFLKVALDHYMADQHDKLSSQKRGGHLARVTMDFEVAENRLTETPPGPDQAFDYAWAVNVMERAFERLRNEFESGLRSGPFDLVEQFFGSGDAPPYKEAAEQHGMSLSQLKSFLHRARARFREILKEEVTDTVFGPDDADDEMASLLALLGG